MSDARPTGDSHGSMRMEPPAFEGNVAPPRDSFGPTTLIQHNRPPHAAKTREWCCRWERRATTPT